MSTSMPSATPALATITNSFYATPTHTSCAGFSIQDYLPNDIVPQANAPWCAISANETTAAFQSCCSYDVVFLPTECVQVCYYNIANTTAAVHNASLAMNDCLTNFYEGSTGGAAFQFECGYEKVNNTRPTAPAASTTAAAANGVGGRSGGSLGWLGAVLLSGLVWTGVA